MTKRAVAQSGLIVSGLGLFLAGAAAAQTYRDGRIRVVEPAVTLQRADESAAEEAFPNMPFLPGDRVWTDGRGRAEFQFADGSVLRLDQRSKLDYVDRSQGSRGESVALRLFSGSVFLHLPERRDTAEFRIEAAGTLFRTDRPGVYRIDASARQADVLVFEGEGWLEGQDRTPIRAGERVSAGYGELLDGPAGFDRAQGDEFAAWDSELEQRAWAGDGQGHLPEEIAPYAGDLAGHGAWYSEVDVGNVWVPYVSAGWRPYSNGYWTWTAYGWTWVPQERWGWAPFHYGRWGWSGRLGYYWIPGHTWGPAWVSWAVGGDSIGWCALGRHDRALAFHDQRYRGGDDRAVPRNPGAASTWTFARRQDLASRTNAGRRVGAAPDGQQAVEVTRGRLGRDLVVRATEENAVPRAGRTRPSPGESVLELRGDHNIVNVPHPAPRSHYQGENQRQSRRSPHPQQQPTPRETNSQREEPQGEAAVPRAPSRPVALAPDGQAEHRARPQRNEESDRDVLRRVFEPLNQPRNDGNGQAEPGARRRPEAERPRPNGDGGGSSNASETFRPHRARPENQPARQQPRAAPAPPAPPPPPPPPANANGSDENRAQRRKKDKNQ